MQSLAVQSYVKEHGGSEAEALRRIELQDRIAPSLAKLRALMGDRYAGAWFDHADDGRLKVGLVDKSSVASQRTAEVTKRLLHERGVLDEADFVDAEWSYDELVEAQRQVTEAVDGLRGSGGATTAVDVETNSVVVTRSRELTSAARARLDGARRSTPVPVREEAVAGDVLPTPDNVPACPPYCDRPLRGGVRIENTGASCTAGFNATSRSDGKRYLLTAGHCDTTQAFQWVTKIVPGGNEYPIGQGHRSNFMLGGDAAIIRVAVPSYWQQPPFPGSTVVVDASGGTTYNPSYQINSEADAVPGQILCVTGVGWDGALEVPLKFWDGTPYESYSWCGTVTRNPVTIDYGGHAWKRVNNLVQTNICHHDGMSGGPAYKLNTAYGLISGSWCSHQQGYLYPAIRAENDMNVNIVH